MLIAGFSAGIQGLWTPDGLLTMHGERVRNVRLGF
jgi:hypothetical protein